MLLGTLVSLRRLLRRARIAGADEGARTPGLDLGKVALYRLSYVRVQSFIPAPAVLTAVPSEILS